MVVEYGIASIVIGVGLISKFYKEYRYKSASKELSTSKVRSLAVGLAELKDKVVPSQDVITSAFLKNKCVYQKIRIEKEKHSKHGTYWVKVKEFEDSRYFFLQDDTGLVLIDPRKSKVDIGLPKIVYSDYQGYMEEFDSICNAKNIRVKGLLFGRRRLRMQQFVIPANKSMIYVLGYAGKNTFENNLSNQNLMIKKHGSLPFLITTKREEDIWKSYGGEKHLLGGIGLIILGIGLSILGFIYGE